MEKKFNHEKKDAIISIGGDNLWKHIQLQKNT